MDFLLILTREYQRSGSVALVDRYKRAATEKDMGSQHPYIEGIYKLPTPIL